MALNEEHLQRACEAFNAATGQPRNAVVAAIETYLAEMFKPDKGMILEPLEAIPQRDYRKDLWIAAYLENGSTRDAHIALEGFDQAFPKENNHG